MLTTDSCHCWKADSLISKIFWRSVVSKDSLDWEYISGMHTLGESELKVFFKHSGMNTRLSQRQGLSGKLPHGILVTSL